MLEGCVPWSDDRADLYRKEGYWKGTSLGDLLHDACEKHAERTALVCDERRMSYTELSENSSTLARRLSGLGVKPLDRIVVQLPNVPEFAVVIFALFRIGAIPVLAFPGHRTTEIAHLCSYSGAVGYVIMDQFQGCDYRALARTVCADTPDIQHVLVHGDEQEFLPLYAPGLPSPRHSFPQVDPSEPALFLLSGGTTGLPKLIPRTHDDYAYNILAAADGLRIGSQDAFLAVNPVAHNAALGCPGLLGTLLMGGKAVLTSSLRADTAFTLIDREAVTFSILVPPLASMWVDHAQKHGNTFPQLILQVGSAKFTAAQAERLRGVLGCRLSQMYGVGEGMLTHTRLDDPEEVVLNSVGRPMAEADEILVADTTGQPVPDGQAGELLLRGPYTICGYYRAPEHNSRAFTADGFFRTGDLVRRRPDDNIVMVGRINDIINRGGDKVSAEEVEEHLLAHSAVQDAAVVGVESAQRGERTVAFVILGDDTVPLPPLKQFLRKRGLATFKIPDKLISATELPRTAVGKVDKTALRSQVT